MFGCSQPAVCLANALGLQLQLLHAFITFASQSQCKGLLGFFGLFESTHDAVHDGLPAKKAGMQAALLCLTHSVEGNPWLIKVIRCFF